MPCVTDALQPSRKKPVTQDGLGAKKQEYRTQRMLQKASEGNDGM